MREELLISGPLDGMDRSDIGVLVYLADMAREGKRLPPAARRGVMSAALEFATDEEATAVYPPLPTETTATPGRPAWGAPQHGARGCVRAREPGADHAGP